MDSRDWLRSLSEYQEKWLVKKFEVLGINVLLSEGEATFAEGTTKEQVKIFNELVAFICRRGQKTLNTQGQSTASTIPSTFLEVVKHSGIDTKLGIRKQGLAIKADVVNSSGLLPTAELVRPPREVSPPSMEDAILFATAMAELGEDLDSGYDRAVANKRSSARGSPRPFVKSCPPKPNSSRAAFIEDVETSVLLKLLRGDSAYKVTHGTPETSMGIATRSSQLVAKAPTLTPSSIPSGAQGATARSPSTPDLLFIDIPVLGQNEEFMNHLMSTPTAEAFPEPPTTTAALAVRPIKPSRPGPSDSYYYNLLKKAKNRTPTPAEDSQKANNEASLGSEDVAVLEEVQAPVIRPRNPPLIGRVLDALADDEVIDITGIPQAQRVPTVTTNRATMAEMGAPSAHRADTTVNAVAPRTTGYDATSSTRRNTESSRKRPSNNRGRGPKRQRPTPGNAVQLQAPAAPPPTPVQPPPARQLVRFSPPSIPGFRFPLPPPFNPYAPYSFPSIFFPPPPSPFHFPPPFGFPFPPPSPFSLPPPFGFPFPSPAPSPFHLPPPYGFPYPPPSPFYYPPNNRRQ